LGAAIGALLAMSIVPFLEYASVVKSTRPVGINR
jgi:hypothetical protein